MQNYFAFLFFQEICPLLRAAPPPARPVRVPRGDRPPPPPPRLRLRAAGSHRRALRGLDARHTGDVFESEVFAGPSIALHRKKLRLFC